MSETPASSVENDADLNKIARAICDSEPFMWLMVGSNHTESQLAALRDVWREHYLPAGGGYGARARRVASPGQHAYEDNDSAGRDCLVCDREAADPIHVIPPEKHSRTCPCPSCVFPPAGVRTD